MPAPFKNIYHFFKKSFRRRSIVALLPHQSAQGRHFTLRTWTLILTSMLVLLGAFYLLTANVLLVKDNIQLKTTTYRNVVLKDLLASYRESLATFALESAPQNAYIHDQLASWNQSTTLRPTLAIGGGPPPAQTSLQSQFDIKERALQNKSSLIDETDDLTAILRDDISLLKTNNQTLSNLDQSIQENKRFSAALPLSWPLASGWGESLPTDRPQLLIATLPGTPILSTAEGTVHSLTRIPGKPLAWKLVLQHDFGLETTYIGVANPSVKKGDSVSKQFPLGISLHQLTYQVRIAQKTVPPEAYIFIRY